MDIMATCLDVAKVAWPRPFQKRQVLPLEGKSLLAVLLRQECEGHEVFWRMQYDEDCWTLRSEEP